MPEVDFIEIPFDKKAQTMGIRKREVFLNSCAFMWVITCMGVAIYQLS